LTEVWEQDLLPILEREPAVQAVTLLRHLQRCCHVWTARFLQGEVW
jgi:hypothetical protein